MKALDLFAGGGGFSLGLKNAEFSVVGVDINPTTKEIFEINNIGETIIADLMHETIEIDVPLVVGGPPCQPWALSNVYIKYTEHPLRPLLKRFFEHIFVIKPQMFIMENVPRIKMDNMLFELIAEAEEIGYSVRHKEIRYCDYGAASGRKRLFVVGYKDSPFGANEFFLRIEMMRRPPQTVRDAIWWLRDIPRNGYNAHDWPDSNILKKDNPRFSEHKFGARKLDYDKPANSAGNVSKVYVLHPEAWENEELTRIISIREALCIIGFPKEYMLPENMSRKDKYQIAANAVSPKFSFVCGVEAKSMIEEKLRTN